MIVCVWMNFNQSIISFKSKKFVQKLSQGLAILNMERSAYTNVGRNDKER